MNHTELTANQNNFGIQISSLEINNKLSLADQGISVSNPNSNTLMINSVIPTHININSSSMLNSTLNNQRPINLPEMKNYNLAILAKPNSASASSINSNLVIHPNNTIKLVNLSKCPQIPNLGKDNNNTVVQNNTINVQILSNTTGSESSNSIQPNCKIESITLNPNSITTSSSNQSVSTNSSLTGTRFVIQGASPQFLPHGTLTLIPQTSDMANSSTANNHLIKSPKLFLAGSKHQNQTIRPISGSISSVINQNNVSKQPINIISPSKPINNFGSISGFNISDVSNSTVIQDISINRGQNFSQRCSKNVTLPVKIPSQYSVSSYNNNNIRLALTSGINNSRIHTNTNQSKIQLISPKSRKRSGSPMNLLSDGKIRNTAIGCKDEHAENSVTYNSQLGKYSPTRKRARKQHLNSVNTKSQKPIINQKVLLNNKMESNNHLNNIRPALIDKAIPNTVVVTSSTPKVSNTVQNKLDECLPLSASTSINALIITGIKNSIQLCPPKTSTINQTTAHRPTSIYTNNGCNNVLGTNNNSNATITPINQFQIISQNQNIKQIQVSQNFILSPKIKCQTPFTPSKVIHIAPSISNINKNTVLKSETLTSEPVVIALNDEKSKLVSAKIEKPIEPLKSEPSNIKTEPSEDSNVKISLFPVKYQWNAKKNHFMKKSDVKFKKSKPTTNSKFPTNLSSTEHQEDNNVNNDVDINDVGWLLYKAFGQITMQKNFDEENLQKIYQLKKKFDTSPDVDDLYKPVFRKICEKTQYYSPIPDKIDFKCLSKHTDPNLFGIAEDIIDNYVNSLSKSDSEMCDDDRFSNSQPHECTQSCIFYSLEVPPPTKPQKFSKIIDLIEGLIVKEKNIIEKESEIKDQFLKYLHELSDFTSLNKNSPTITNTNPDRFKLLTGYRR